MPLPLPLVQLATLGAAFIGHRADGTAIASGDAFADAFTSDIAELTALWDGLGESKGRGRGEHIRRFMFEPARLGFIVLDLDRKNGKDGVADLLACFAGKPLPVPLTDLDNGSHPCTVHTPSGGLHLYYRAPGKCYSKTNLTPSGAVELFNTGSRITAPGSMKDGKSYTLQGSFEQAPPWTLTMDALVQSIKEERDKKDKARAALAALRPPMAEKQKASLDLIMEWKQKDNPGAGRHDLCLYFATTALTRYGYTQGDVIAYLESHPATAGHTELRAVVKSIGGKHGL